MLARLLSLRQLTSIKNLLGRQGGHFLIFGLLTRLEDGALYLEDLDDKVELDLSDAVSDTSTMTCAIRTY